MKTSPSFVALLLLALVASGCKQGGGPEPTAPPEPPQPAAPVVDDGSTEPPEDAVAPAEPTPPPVVTAAGTLAPVPPPLVTLLDAGAEPRSALRLSATAGQVERATIAMGMRVETSLDGAAAVARVMPRGRMELEARVEAVSEHGEATWVVTVTEAAVDEGAAEDGADPALVASMRQALGAVAGAVAGGRVTDRGVTNLAAFEARADVDEEARALLEGFRESLQQLAVPLPAERVGPGARWQVEQIVSQGGMQIRQTTVFDLVGVSEPEDVAEGSPEAAGRRVDLRASFTQVAEAEAAGGPLPPGGRLLAFAGSGTGEVSLDLGRILPSSSRARVDTRVRMAVPAADGQSQEIVLAMEIELALGSGGAVEGAAE